MDNDIERIKRILQLFFTCPFPNPLDNSLGFFITMAVEKSYWCFSKNEHISKLSGLLDHIENDPEKNSFKVIIKVNEQPIEKH